MRIIETVTEFESFLESNKDFDWVIVPTYCNGDRSVYTDRISLIYIYVLIQDTEALLVLDHTEGLHIPENVIGLFPNDRNIFVYGKKRFKRFSSAENLIDIDMIEYFQRNRPLADDFDTPAHEFFTRQFGTFTDLNTIIPISKHIERSQNIVQRFLDVYDYFQKDDSFDKYNSLILDSLYEIEKNGLYVDTAQFTQSFKNSSIHKNLTYSEYNVYTTTGRPSNRFGGINFAALNKDSGQRAAFVSRFGTEGFLVSFDYDAYHLRLLAELIDYKFPDAISVHEYLGQFYFGKERLTTEEYKESKSISFRQLYGGVSTDYLAIPFFDKVHQYTQLLWDMFREDGYIETPLFGRKLFRSFFTDMNASKLLNYMLQAFETERNMAVINSIQHRTQSYKSHLVLYTYDSFLFDYNLADGLDFLKIVRNELEQCGKYPTKLEIGPNYNDMILMNKKF